MGDILIQVKTFILGLNPDYVGIAVFVFNVISTVLITIYISILEKERIIQNFCSSAVSSLNNTVEGYLRVTKWKYFNYDELKLYISKCGLGYMSNETMTPVKYMGLRVLAALGMGIVGAQFSMILGVVLIPVGFMMVDLIMNASDKSDNDKMLDDIKAIYDTLRIQTKAGVYITSVLADCYLVVQNKRLKKAFLALTSDLAAKNNPEDALEDFKNKFNNPYLDALVVIILQSMVTGQSAQMFDDIKVQILDIEQSMVIAEESRIKTQIVIVQLLLYVAIVVVAIFMAVTEITAIGL